MHLKIYRYKDLSCLPYPVSVQGVANSTSGVVTGALAMLEPNHASALPRLRFGMSSRQSELTTTKHRDFVQYDQENHNIQREFEESQEPNC